MECQTSSQRLDVAENNENNNNNTVPLSPASRRKTFPFETVVAPVSVDIGGSFTKMVYWRPPDPPDLPAYIIKDFQNGEPRLPLKPDPTLKISFDEDGVLRFLKFESSRTAEFIQFLFDTGLHEQYGPNKTKVINATGGGAYKYADDVHSKLGIVFGQQDEMKCLIRGLNWLLREVDNEAFHYDWRNGAVVPLSGAEERSKDPKYPYPYLLVNVGSGVSVLKVLDEETFERVSGTSLGGGTFWGLCKMLTAVKSFDDVRELCNKGDNKNVDLIVGDIYGKDYSALGLKADVIASSFGKVATKREELVQEGPWRQEDIVRSLLFMISNNIGQIAYLNAQLLGMKRVFFSGGFLQENPYVWGRFSYAVDFWSKGEMKAVFPMHNSYLGVLGAFLAPLPSHDAATAAASASSSSSSSSSTTTTPNTTPPTTPLKAPSTLSSSPSSSPAHTTTESTKRTPTL